MTDATPAAALSATASDTAAADPAAPHTLEDRTLIGKLSAALSGIVSSEQDIGCWSDEPLRLADFIA
jgi:hypothetical protein